MSTITETTTASERAELESEFLMINPSLRVLSSGPDHVVVIVPGAPSSFQLGRALYDLLQQFRTPNRVADLPIGDTRRAALLRSVRRLHASRVMVAPASIGIAFTEADRGVAVQECPFTDARQPRRVRQLTTSLALPGTGEWVLNPEAALRLVSDRGQPVIRATCPVPGTGLRSSAIALDAERDVFTFLAGLIHGSSPSTPGPETLAVLEAAGLVVRPDRVPEPVPFRLPAGAVADLIADGLVPGDPEPATHTDEERFLATCLTEDDASDDHRIVWCDDRRRGMRWPLWFTPAQLEEARRLAPDPAQTAELREMGRQWNDALAAVQGQLSLEGFGIVRGLLPAAVVSGFAGYYQRLKDNGHLLAGDKQAQRDTLHNERAARWLHAHVRELVQRAIPEPVKCSYSYLGLYHPGASLARHTDRAQCEYTLSLTIHASSSRQEEAWPLYLQPDGREPVEVLLSPSDGAIFKGRSIPHYRERLAEGRTSWSMFFHFVPVGFEGSLD